MRISIRWIVIIGCIILVWSTHLIITPSVYFSTKKVMLQHTMDIMENISDLILHETQNFFSVALGSAQLTNKLISSKVVNTDNGNIEKLEQYFFDQLEIYPQFAGIYLAKPNGNFYYVSRNSSNSTDGYRTKIVEYNNQNRETRLIWRDKDMNVTLKEIDKNNTYDPRIRPWYIKAAKEKQIIWTDPYIFFTSQKPGITIADPIYNTKGEIKGIVGVDIQLDVLSNFISKLRVGKTGLAFMMNQNRKVIAFPDPEQLKHANEKKPGKIRLPKINELKNQICGKAYNSIEWENLKPNNDNSEKPIFGTFQFENKKYYTMFTAVPESKVSWMIGLYIPEEDYFKEINANQKQNQLFALIISVIATIVGLIMASSITRPISELDRAAQKIKNNDYESLSEIKSGFIEIQRTAHTFHEMKKAVIDYKKELMEKEKIHRAIADTANDAIIMVDTKGKISYWNMAAEIIFGYTKEETIENYLYDMIIPKKNRKNAGLILSDFCITGNKDMLKTNIEIITLHKNGNKIPVELSVARIKIEKMWYAVAIIRDITIRKKVEAEKINVIKRLQQSQKMESIGTLAGGISHDFNNILFPILGNTEILRLEIPADNQLQDNINEIYAATIRASALAEQILTFARPESHEIKPIEIQPIINEALTLMRSVIPTTIKIKQDIEKDCGIIKADPTHIHQIIMNLTTNAYHAMENTGGELKVSLKNVLVTASDIISSDMKPGEYAYLSIADTGIGMSEDVIEKIFYPFFTTKGNGKGSGMGLSVVHGIVTSLNGAIKVDSKPDKGSKFNIYLPKSKSLLIKKKTQAMEQTLTGTERILLIDDEKTIIKMEQSMLERLGYNVVAHDSSTEALKTFSAAPDEFDIIITDMSMPGMPGNILATELKKIRQDIPIILCTGFNNKISLVKAEDMGFKGFLPKPITIENLSKKIRQVLGE
ncbi:MAG: PAS domain S-box protein [Desulfobacterales bacterium]|nr:PAS domain S-box protein [Desulfobacterales bacterium]